MEHSSTSKTTMLDLDKQLKITKHNISSCKHVRKIAELRHMDGVKGRIELSDTELIVTTRIEKETLHVIHSNVKQLVEQQQSVFETLWKKAIPAEQKIREIEDGIKPPETKVLEDPDEIFNHMMYVIGNASKRLICSPSGAMQMVYDNFFDLYKKILDKHRSRDGIRWLTIIDKENKDIVKVFLVAGVKVRHVRNLPPINFAVDDTNFHATIEKMEGGKIMETLLSSNEPKYVNYYTSLFEGLWNNGIDAETRIKDIEEGTDSANIEIIQNSYEALKRSSNLVRNANEEVLFMFSTPNALRRQLQVQSLLQFNETIRERPFVKIKILVPSDGQIKETIEELRVEYPQVDFRIYEQGLNSRITIVLVDKRECMIIEVK